MQRPLIETVGPDNLAQCGIGCLVDRKHPGFEEKVAWLRDRFPEGLRLLLARDPGGRPLAFLEYVPGESAWRPVEARGWIFVHCLWVYPAGKTVGGLGSALINECVLKARELDAVGVAAVVSDGPWMADRRIFLRNGFQKIASAGRFELVACRFRAGADPRFRDIEAIRSRYQGLHLVISSQCPLLARSVHDLSGVAAAHGLKLTVTRLGNASQAQNAPSLYGVFALMWNGRILSDHYVSRTRFRNLIRKEILRDDS